MLKVDDIIISKNFWQPYRGSINIIRPNEKYNINAIIVNHHKNNDIEMWLTKIDAIKTVKFHGTWTDIFYSDISELRRDKLKKLESDTS